MGKTRSLIVSVGFLGASAVIAQEVPTTEQLVEEIRVVAPRNVTRERLPFGQGEQVSLSYKVSHADLDLRQNADVRELEKRIETVANEICARLEEMFARGDPSQEECAERAIEKAMADARAVVDALTAP